MNVYMDVSCMDDAFIFNYVFSSQLLSLGLSDCACRMGIFFQVRFVVLDQIGHNVGTL